MLTKHEAGTDEAPNDETPSDEVKLRRIRQPLRLVAFLVIVGVSLAVAFVGGMLVRLPQQDAIQAADTLVPVFAKVEGRVVAEELRAPLALVPGKTRKYL